MVYEISYYKKNLHSKKFFKVSKGEMEEEFFDNFPFLQYEHFLIYPFKNGYLISTFDSQFVVEQERFIFDCSRLIEINCMDEVFKVGDHMKTTRYEPDTFEIPEYQ